MVLIAIFIIAVLKYLNFKFHLSKDDFHLSTGIINKDNTIIPKSKIQNVYIKQNFLQQLINVVSVKIETAGDKKSEIEISALDKPMALLLKKELFTKEKIENAPTEDVEERNVFFKASPKRLILEGLSQNHLKSFAVIASFIFGAAVDLFSNDRGWLAGRIGDALGIHHDPSALPWVFLGVFSAAGVIGLAGMLILRKNVYRTIERFRRVI